MRQFPVSRLAGRAHEKTVWGAGEDQQLILGSYLAGFGMTHRQTVFGRIPLARGRRPMSLDTVPNLGHACTHREPDRSGQ